jgi:hypothetical protein
MAVTKKAGEKTGKPTLDSLSNHDRKEAQRYMNAGMPMDQAIKKVKEKKRRR